MLLIIAVCALLVISQSLVSGESEQKRAISIPLSQVQIKQIISDDILNSVLETFKDGIEIQILNPTIEGNSLKFDLGFKRKSVQSLRDDNRQEDEEQGEKRNKRHRDQSEERDPEEDEVDDDTHEQNDQDTIIHDQGFNTGFLSFGDSFEMMDTSMIFQPTGQFTPHVTCGELMSRGNVSGAGCVKESCCASKQQVHQPGVCQGRDVCCFSANICRQEPTTQPPTTQLTTVGPIDVRQLTTAGPVDVRAPRDNCTGLVVQGSTSIGCIQNGCCEGHRQVARFCPGTDVCCFSKDFCAAKAECSRRSKQLACRILDRERDGLITLAMNHSSSGHQDYAYPRLNLQHTCNNQKSQRSSYSCPDLCKTSPAPGGSTCLSPKMLQYIESLIISRFNGIYITAITGGCHKCGSKHYDGLAVDLKKQGDFQKFLSRCRSMGGKGLDSDDHINCQFFE
ncbi:hypothetical protein LOTGIDRAFT_163448 [Lottia gigantea]|uniref:Uncharacterized protein n=1 Tax=Lottia gigantea TaxID=225164 RepID=V4ACC2_LOTGI|nr:hypothetical protein LOTGIDRAFT_163448 [Lottia gigantea]ESO90941.1 hypothetical protein LOTGIDRAFT_163448 [Lottia gigantea]